MNKELIYLPRSATIKRVKKLTSLDSLFQLEMDDSRPLGHMPGQFVEVSVMGIGEAPISISSSPTDGKRFDLCIRSIGSVTYALHRLKVGDKVGIRGPFGKGFDTEFLKGKDLLFAAGGLGIAPLRSLIRYILNNRADYGRIMLLYGCKQPCEMLFSEELEGLAKRHDVEQHLTVDKCPDGQCWLDSIGVIPTLIPKVDFDPSKTYAVVCGPPIMYKFVIKSFKEKGMPDDHILLSLERRMKCGVGKCGHCQINGVYVCQDGPVFNYVDIKDLPEAL